MKITIDIPEGEAHAVAGILDMVASERRTASGRVAAPGKGVEHSYRESFRVTLYAVAMQIRRTADEVAEAERDRERYGPAVRPMEVAGAGTVSASFLHGLDEEGS